MSGPYFNIPDSDILKTWIATGVRVRGVGQRGGENSGLTKREKQIFTSLLHFAIQKESGLLKSEEGEVSVVSGADIAHYLERQEGEAVKAKQYVARLRQIASQMNELGVFDRDEYRPDKKAAGRPSYIYTLLDPATVLANSESFLKDIDEETLSFNEELQRKKVQQQDLKAAYESRDDIYLSTEVNSDEPWSVKLLSTLLDRCCRENLNDGRSVITAETMINDEVVKVKAYAANPDENEDSQIMLMSDQRWLMGLFTLNAQRMLMQNDIDATKNRFAVDIVELLKAMNYKNTSGGNRKVAWNAISRIRHTEWEVKLDPNGELAKKLSEGSGGKPRDTIYIRLLNDFMTGQDENKSKGIPRYFEYSIMGPLFSGIVRGEQGLIVHPNLLEERNGFILNIYSYLRRALAPGEEATYNTKQLHKVLGVSTPYANFTSSTVRALLKMANSEEPELGDVITFNFFGFHAQCRVEGKVGYLNYEWTFTHPGELEEQRITDIRNQEIREKAGMPKPEGLIEGQYEILLTEDK